MRVNIKYVVLLIMVSFWACKQLNTNPKIISRPLPSNFGYDTDSSTIALLNWKQYFKDSTLISLIDSGIQHNLDLKIALQRIESVRADVLFYRGQIFPKVNADIRMGVTKYGEYTMDGAGNKVTEITPGQLIPENLPDMLLGLKSSWEVDIWKKLRNKKGAAYSRYLGSVEAKNYILTRLIADIAIYYYELLAADNELEILELTLIKQQAALDVIKEQKEAGRTNELAVQQFMSQVYNTKAMKVEALQKIFLLETGLNKLLGRYPQKILREKQNLYKEIALTVRAGIPSQLLDNRPDIKNAGMAVQASRFELKSARAAFFPSFNISAGLGFQAFNPSYLFLAPASLAYSLLGGLTAPLINMSAIRAQFNKASASQIQNLHQYQKVVLDAYVDVVNDLSNVSKQEEIVQLKTSQTEVSLLAVDISTDLYRSAKAGYLDVLLAQQYALKCNLELVNANKQLKLALIAIYRDLGGGWR